MALGRQTLDAGDYEAVVSIDRSSDGTREMLERLRVPYGLTVTSALRPGRASAQNAALAVAGGDVLVILDDDMEPAPELLERHLAHHPPGSCRCVVGAAPIPERLVNTQAGRYWAWKFDEHLDKLAAAGHVMVAPEFYSGNASLRTEALREIGGFDERFLRYGHEDVDLFIRLRAAGVEVSFDPAALAHQGYDRDVKGLARAIAESGATAVQLARSRPEVIEHLRLGQLHHTSLKRQVIRAALLAASRRRPQTPERVYALASVLERLGFGRRRVFYEALLDFAFWSGAAPALADPPAPPALAPLRDDVRRGPIDLVRRRPPSLRGRGGQRQCVVLAYHAIADHAEDPLLRPYSVPPARFAAQLDALSTAGWTFVDASRVLRALAGEAPLPRRAVLVTLDDGYEDVSRVALPLLAERGIPAVAFVVGGQIGADNAWDGPKGAKRLRLMDPITLRTVADAGVELGAHGLRHVKMTELAPEALATEARGGREQLAALGLGTPRLFAYPYGHHDASAEAAVRAAGHEAAFTIEPGLVTPESSRYALPRVMVLRGYSPKILRLRIALARWPLQRLEPWFERIGRRD